MDVLHDVNGKTCGVARDQRGGAVPQKFVCCGLISAIIHLDDTEARS